MLTGLELVGFGAAEFGVAGLRRAMLDGTEAKLRTAKGRGVSSSRRTL